MLWNMWWDNIWPTAAGWFLVVFWLLSGSLLFAVALVIPRMIFAEAYVVEYVAE
jgi:hypothetical protein